MVLVLEVTGWQDELPPRERSKRFESSGPSSIGRGTDCTWQLDNLDVSNHHADIDFSGGTFRITDTSRNGTKIRLAGSVKRLVKGVPQPIMSGDQLTIGPFTIRVSIDAADAHQNRSPARDVFVDASDVSKGSASPSPATLDLDSLFGPEAPKPKVRPLIPGPSAQSEHFRPPAPVTANEGAGVIPSGYDPKKHDDVEADRPIVVSQQKTPVVSPEPASSAPRGDPGSDAALRLFLRGAGIPDAEMRPDIAQSLGEILRVVVAGVMDALTARQAIKDELRIKPTRLRAKDNNPLKFSSDVDDALYNLFVKRNPAYLGPVESFDEVFGDLKLHQVAFLAGVRVAFEGLLAEFRPERLQQEFDSRLKKSLLATSREAQYWSLYRSRAADMARDPEVTFKKLFWDRLMRAYEDEMRRLKEKPPNVET